MGFLFIKVSLFSSSILSKNLFFVVVLFIEHKFFVFLFCLFNLIYWVTLVHKTIKVSSVLPTYQSGVVCLFLPFRLGLREQEPVLNFTWGHS